MAKGKKSLGPADWYLISIDRLKKIGVVLLLAVIAGGTYFYLDSQKRDPRQRAESAIADAEDALNDLASSDEFTTYKAEFERGRVKLEEARRLLAREDFPESEGAAIEAHTIAQSALARQPGERDSDAQFLSVEGDVQLQKASSSEWKKADARTPLFNGDWVKTGGSASAELIFSNGSLYTVGPNALLEIYSAVNPATSKKQNTVQMQVGSVEINTTDDISTVKTPGTQVVVNSESTAQVGVDAGKSTEVLSLKGTAAVTPTSGGTGVQLASGETVKASGAGALSTKRQFLQPPALSSPPDNQTFRGASDSRVQFSWVANPKAVAYQLQVSRSRLFAGVEINAQRTTPNATARVSSEGSFYWRVASIDDRGQVGPFSTFRRFRVSGVGSTPTQAAESDKTPPTLQLKRPFNIGGAYYMIEGRVEPGATVFINDDEVDVQPDGVFKKLVSFTAVGWNNVIVKAIDPAGNETVQAEKVHVKE